MQPKDKKHPFAHGERVFYGINYSSQLCQTSWMSSLASMASSIFSMFLMSSSEVRAV